MNNEFSVDNLTCMVDLHLHLDGALSKKSVRELAKLQNIEVPEDEAELEALLTVSPNCRDLNEFLEKFAFPLLLLQTETGLKTAAANLARELKAQGVMYAEIRFAPQLSTDKGLTQEQVVEAALAGLKEVAGIETQLILCCMRGKGIREANLETVRVAKKFLNRGVCALDLAGAEALFPNEEFEDIFRAANANFLPLTIHSGEAAGFRSVESALGYGARRIGHGVRATENDSTLAKLAHLNIPLEFCPSSNLLTKVFASVAEYPLRMLLAAGIPVTVNTDDPTIIGTSLKREFRLLIDTFGLTRSEVRTLLINAANASFAPESLKARMRARIEEEVGEEK